MIRAALAAAALAAALAAPAAAEEQSLRIGEVRVQPLDVFSPEEAARGWVYRTANSVRFQTRENVIRKFLLFQEGDAFDAARLVETERNLRSQPFLKFASVTAGEPHDGVVDVDVVTQDAWTTEPGISFGGRGGETTYSFDLKEKDFLGTGRQVAIAHQKGTERTTHLFQYVDPYLFGPYWLGDFAYSVNSDGEEERIGVRRGFASFVDRWAINGLFDHVRSNGRIFAAGETLSRFRQKHTEGVARYGWALQASDERARRVFVGFQESEDRFAPLPGAHSPVIPDERRFRYLTVAYQDVENAFVKLNYVNRDARYEDFNLGRSLFLEVAVSPSAFGTPHTTERLRASAAQGWTFGGGSFLLARLAYETRWEGAPANEILSGSLLYVRKFGTAQPLQTFVSRLTVDRGWRLDKDVQFFADADSGLRAYHLYAFEGDKRIVWNAEQRFFLGREFLQLFSPGAAVFFDTGAATPPGQPLGIKDFKSDVGFGLRIAITRAASNSVLRFDLAYALNPDARGRRGLLFSFSSGQVF